MKRETPGSKAKVFVILDGDTDAGYRLARRLLAEGRRVVAVAPHAGAAIRVMHGQPAERVMVIAADLDDPRQWSRMSQRVIERFGRMDTVVRAEDATLPASG